MTNENIAPSEVTDNVGDERGDAFRGIPKLSCLDLYLAIPRAGLGFGMGLAKPDAKNPGPSPARSSGLFCGPEPGPNT